MRIHLAATAIALCLSAGAMAQPVAPANPPNANLTAPMSKPMMTHKTAPKRMGTMPMSQTMGKTELGECSSENVDQSRADCMMMQYNPGGAHYHPPG